MGELVTLILFSFALSLDSFTAGFTFGLRKITISIKAVIAIGIVTGFVFLIALLIGKQLAHLFTERTGDIIGGSLFIVIGIWVIYQFFRERDKGNNESKSKSAVVLKWEIKSLGIVIQILKDPDSADFDHSGDIRGLEAILLGAALSIDAFGAGIAAAMLGFTPFLTALIMGTMSSLFLWIGTKSGSFLAKWSWVQNIAFIPGIILIVLGCWKLY
ncbi:sporulation membrane protein YtaF [Salirhabdus sp. Marseille-P4669]|uniref:sporulation membrane protein YtaF n=1 Tax=Salirhabdus sp. Marseille-P4669 TaxID=2042310 RepID=UPI001357FD04|nr:sporulation membrane protein YtaF [Salirhabdus sp. Marseille-P4669]